MTYNHIYIVWDMNKMSPVATAERLTYLQEELQNSYEGAYTLDLSLPARRRIDAFNTAYQQHGLLLTSTYCRVDDQDLLEGD